MFILTLLLCSLFINIIKKFTITAADMWAFHNFVNPGNILALLSEVLGYRNPELFQIYLEIP